MSPPLPATAERTVPPVARLLNASLLAWLVLVPFALWLAPQELWAWQFRATPSVAVAVALVAGVAVALGLGNYAHRHRCNALLAVVLGAAHLCVQAQPLGDHGFWLREAANPFVGASEPLANLLHHAVYLLGGRDALFWVSPVAGAVFAWCYLDACDALFVRDAGADQGAMKKLCCLSLLAASWHVMFARGYVENPQLGLPLVLLAVRALTRYTTPPVPGASPRRSFLAASAWLALSGLVHGVTTALLPALPLIAWLFPPKGRTGGQRTADVLLGLLLWVALVAVVMLGLRFGLGLYVYQGNLHWYMFMPLVPVSWVPTTLQSPEHLRFVANILLLASPLTLAVPLGLLLPATRPHLAVARLRHPGLLILALGYCGFTLVFYFALGFPKDFDLIFSLAALLHLHLLQVTLGWLRSRGARGLLAVVLLVSGAAAWSLHGGLMVPSPPVPGPHPRGGLWSGTLTDAAGVPVPVLRVNGRTQEVWLRGAEDLTLAVHTPPGSDRPARFALVHAGLEPGAGATPIAALAATLTGGPGTGLQFVTDNLLGQDAAQVTRSTPAPWISERPFALGHPGTTEVLQGVIEDAQGRRALTNAVIVHWP